MKRKIYYTLHSGKNSKFAYYLRNYLRLVIPTWITYLYGKRLLKGINQRADKEYITKRIDYYCQIETPTPLPKDAQRICDTKIPRKQKVYYFDSKEITRYFNQRLRWQLLGGDITYVPETPSIVKSRPIGQDNINSVILNMDKVRHFIFVHDTTPWEAKQAKAIFMGKVAGKAERIQFMNMYFGSNICECGDVSKDISQPREWQKEKKTIQEQLEYRYIMALEGNDVASNLKWVMSSNSIAVMPQPTCETWYMEGTLIPNYHYIEIKADYSDLEAKLKYYNSHVNEAMDIIAHAHEYVEQFKDKHRERLIAIGVMNKYLNAVNI